MPPRNRHPTAASSTVSRGELRRATLELWHTSADWRFVAGLRQASGLLEYTGQTQLGLPLFTQTDLSRREWAAFAEHRWQLDADGPALFLGAGLASLRTVRGIRATPISSPLTENPALPASGRFTPAPTSVTALADMPLRLGASLQWHRPWRQTLAVDTHGVVDPFELQPARRWGGRLGLSADLSVGARFDVGLGHRRRGLSPRRQRSLSRSIAPAQPSARRATRAACNRFVTAPSR